MWSSGCSLLVSPSILLPVKSHKRMKFLFFHGALTHTHTHHLRQEKVCRNSKKRRGGGKTILSFYTHVKALRLYTGKEPQFKSRKKLNVNRNPFVSAFDYIKLIYKTCVKCKRCKRTSESHVARQYYHAKRSKFLSKKEKLGFANGGNVFFRYAICAFSGGDIFDEPI